MKKNYTHLVILIDRSGSMSSIKKDMEGGLNDFIKNQKELEGLCTVTAAQFDTEMDFLYKMADIKTIGKLKIAPRGGTALIDSMVVLIDEVGKELKELSEDNRPEKVLFITITDGEENSSIKYNNSDLASRIKHQEDKYNWQFTYLGANQDSFGVASKLGVNFTKTMNYSADTLGISNMFNKLNSASVRYRTAVGSESDFSYTKDEQENI